MSQYHINDLERLTGVKAHTIRIWEKRYGLIAPDRTGTNRRSYNDDQVRKLLNVATLLSHGNKISKVAQLNDRELNDEVFALSEETTQDHIIAGYINRLINCMLAFDEAGFDKICSAVITRWGMPDAILKVIYPFLYKIGLLWTTNSTVPAQEHFASCIIRRKIAAATDGLLPPSRMDKRFLLCLPPGEWHEIGLLLADHIIRSRGYATIYLGQNVPLENISKAFPDMRPTHVLTFFVSNRPASEMEELVAIYAALAKDVQVLIAGRKDLLPAHRQHWDNVTYLTQVDDLMHLS